MLPRPRITRLLIIIIIIMLLTTLCPPKRCHSLQIFLPSSTRRWLGNQNGRRLSSSTTATIAKPTQRQHGPLLNDYSLNYHWGGGRYYCVTRNPHHRATTIKLYSSNSPTEHHNVESNDNVTTNHIGKAASSFLRKHVSQLEYDGKLSTEEATSIIDTITDSKILEDETAAAALNDAANFSTMLQTSIELFIAQKESRLKSNTRPIANVGGYVRTIIRNQLDKSLSSAVVIDKTTQQQQQQPPPQSNSNGNESNIHTLLQTFIDKGEINATELDESCILSLSQTTTSTETAQTALEAYVRQKQRRVVKDMTPILDPSSYVLKILR